MNNHISFKESNNKLIFKNLKIVKIEDINQESKKNLKIKSINQTETKNNEDKIPNEKNRSFSQNSLNKKSRRNLLSMCNNRKFSNEFFSINKSNNLNTHIKTNNQQNTVADIINLIQFNEEENKNRSPDNLSLFSKDSSNNEVEVTRQFFLKEKHKSLLREFMRKSKSNGIFKSNNSIKNTTYTNITTQHNNNKIRNFSTNATPLDKSLSKLIIPKLYATDNNFKKSKVHFKDSDNNVAIFSKDIHPTGSPISQKKKDIKLNINKELSKISKISLNNSNEIKIKKKRLDDSISIFKNKDNDIYFPERKTLKEKKKKSQSYFIKTDKILNPCHDRKKIKILQTYNLLNNLHESSCFKFRNIIRENQQLKSELEKNDGHTSIQN